MNRAVDGVTLFDRPGEYDAFIRVLSAAGRRYAIRLLAYCVMPNHWHLVVQPEVDRVLSQYMHWLTTTHAQRWRRAATHARPGRRVSGALPWVPVEQDRHFLRLCAYVERNALRAKLTTRAEEWRWSSAWQRDCNDCDGPPLAEWPLPRPPGWLEILNETSAPTATEMIRTCVRAGRPYGTGDWCSQTAAVYEITDGPPGRRPGAPTSLQPGVTRNSPPLSGSCGRVVIQIQHK